MSGPSLPRLNTMSEWSDSECRRYHSQWPVLSKSGKQCSASRKTNPVFLAISQSHLFMGNLIIWEVNGEQGRAAGQMLAHICCKPQPINVICTALLYLRSAVWEGSYCGSVQCRSGSFQSPSPFAANKILLTATLNKQRNFWHKTELLFRCLVFFLASSSGFLISSTLLHHEIPFPSFNFTDVTYSFATLPVGNLNGT